MLFSIIVLSYNRPEQISRILKNLGPISPGNFNLIIKDDCSPRQSEIQEIVQLHMAEVDYEIIFHKNERNLGYDRNLLDCFSQTESEYVFLLSDDDYIDGKHITSLIDVLSRRDFKVYFTPYTNGDSVNRVNIPPYDINNFDEVIYNSVLFSGLIFDRKAVINLPKNESFLANCIYTQVYLASLIIFGEKAFGEVPSGLLYLGGDGENFFGKNEASPNQADLQDRSSMTSNLKYQQFLCSVVREVSKITSIQIFVVFEREYNKRLVAYLARARSLGLHNFFELKKSIKCSRSPRPWYVKFSLLILPAVPGQVAGVFYEFAKKFLKRSG